VFERQSALANALTSRGQNGRDGGRQLRIGEARGWSLLQVAGFAITSPELERALKPVLKVDLPQRVGEAVDAHGRRLFKTGTHQFWIITGDGDDLPPLLNAAVPSAIGAVTPLSHSRTRILIEGLAARSVLSKGIALDFHPDVFPVDSFALTGLHHTPILVHRSGENRYELYVIRTFAQSIWDWLTDAALPLGYGVFVEK
jgi:heterotetrameric sarcosine oxidase gamma subunit